MNKIFDYIINKGLKIINYPSPETSNLFTTLNYDKDHFLSDLLDKFGEEGREKFIKFAIKSRINSENGIKIPIDSHDENSYVVLRIKKITHISDDTVSVDGDIIDSHIKSYESDEYHTISEIRDNIDMSEWNEYVEFLDGIYRDIGDYFKDNFGFYLWLEND